jgi:hypothetical protein
MIAPQKESVGMSSFSLSILDGPMVNLWSADPCSQTEGQYTLDLALGEGVVIGRQEGGQTEYLDPNYQPTQLMPGSLKPIVTSPREGKDIGVSRGHFMLKGSAKGIILVNGVPRRGGGIRPPVNWTWMLEPDHRLIEKAEEVLIQRGTHLKIRLPNDAVILIVAN